MSETFGIAVVGCGYWGGNYVRVFNEILEASVVAVCDQRSESLRKIEPLLSKAHLTTDLQVVLALEDVDAVVVATNATSHYDVVRQCLLAGKHVLVEKPIATNLADSDELTAIAEDRHLTLMVGHTFLYNPAVQALKDYARRGDVGRMYYLSARRTNMGPIRQDINVFWDLAPHDISIFNYLLDSTPEWVSAVGAKILGSHLEDVGFIALGYPGEVVGHIHVSWADAFKVREVVVVGSNQRIVFDDLHASEPIRIFQKGVSVSDEHRLDGTSPYILHDGAIISPRVERSEPLKNQCQHFLDRAARRCLPLSGGSEGRDVVRVLEAIDASVNLGGTPINVNDGASYVRRDNCA